MPIIKKNGKMKFFYYRDLNATTPKDEYPIPIVDMLVDFVVGSEILNLLYGYYGYN